MRIFQDAICMNLIYWLIIQSYLSYFAWMSTVWSTGTGVLLWKWASNKNTTVWDPFMGCSPFKATSWGWFSFFIFKLTSFFSCHHIFVNLALQFPVSANIWLHEVNLLFSLLVIFLSTSLILSDKKCCFFSLKMIAMGFSSVDSKDRCYPLYTHTYRDR